MIPKVESGTTEIKMCDRSEVSLALNMVGTFFHTFFFLYVFSEPKDCTSNIADKRVPLLRPVTIVPESPL